MYGDTCTVHYTSFGKSQVEHDGGVLGVEFKHHYALDDAETCAKVAIEAAQA